MKILSITIQWLIVIAFIVGVYFLFKIKLPIINLQPLEVIILSLSIAFTWTEVLKIGVTKPFNCLKCMTGWISLIIGFLSFRWAGLIFLPIGLFVGALFSSIKMRYL